eukprot:1158382-Pelagomonas_calceolata.AAC.5
MLGSKITSYYLCPLAQQCLTGSVAHFEQQMENPAARLCSASQKRAQLQCMGLWMSIAQHPEDADFIQATVLMEIFSLIVSTFSSSMHQAKIPPYYMLAAGGGQKAIIQPSSN